MIKIECDETHGWDAAIAGMRNPMNSWDKSDSKKVYEEVYGDPFLTRPYIEVGKNDLALMRKLANAGTDHRKFMRMITVYCDITAPLYWWKEFDTYKVGTVANSCSTMHKIQAKEFTTKDFSCEHIFKTPVKVEMPNSLPLLGGDDLPEYNIDTDEVVEIVISALNNCREKYLETKDKKYWWQMIQLLPSSYNQKRTVMLNYEVLANIYKSRKNHKLDEWHDFCDWIKTLPYSELIINPGCGFENERAM